MLFRSYFTRCDSYCSSNRFCFHQDFLLYLLKLAKPVTLKVAPSRGYDFNGGPELTDGLSGNDNYKTGRWLGFQGKDLDAVIDLKEPTEFSKVSFNTNVVKGDWIMGTAGVTVKVSDDGQNFKEVAYKVIPSLGKDDKIGRAHV